MRRKNTTRPPASRRPILVFGLLAALILIAYANSSRGLLLLDNERIILKDTRIRDATSDNIRQIVTAPYWQSILGGLYRPLATLSYLCNYAVLGNAADPAGYHWINLLLHLANVGLVFALARAIFREAWTAGLVGALWGLHPLLTESVTNVIGRADLLAAFGVLAALFCHRAAADARGARRAAWLAALALAAAIGVFSKESATVAIAILVLHDLTLAKGRWRAPMAAGYAAAALPCAAYWWMRTWVLAHALAAPIPFVDNPLAGAGFWMTRLTALGVIGKSVLLWLWPARLSYDYSYNEIGLPIAGVLVCLLLAAAPVWFWRRNRIVTFGIAFFFIGISPTSNLLVLIGSIMAERFLYLASAGLAVAALALVLPLARRAPYRSAALPVAAIVLLALAARTYARNEDWAHEQRFWRSGVEAAPGSFRTHILAAFQSLPLTPENQPRIAADADRALAILDPLPAPQSHAEAYRDAGTIYRLIGDRIGAGPVAELWYRKSLAALQRSERIELARAAVLEQLNAARGRPGVSYTGPGVYLELGRAWSRLGDAQHALAAFERGHEQGSDPDLLEELAAAYESAGEYRKAAMALVEALAVDSRRAQLMARLVALYQRADPLGCSTTRDGSRLVLDVDCPLVHGDICLASRNVAVHFDRDAMPRDAAYIRGVAVRDLACPADSLR